MPPSATKASQGDPYPFTIRHAARADRRHHVFGWLQQHLADPLGGAREFCRPADRLWTDAQRARIRTPRDQFQIVV
jgi:hypothetical protein